MNTLKKLGLSALTTVAAATTYAANPQTLDELQTSLSAKFATVETIAISGFVLGGAIVIGMITLHWVNRGSKAKVK